MDSQIKINALKDPAYCPYCMRCSGLVRMVNVETMLWRCEKCGAVHDERDPAPCFPQYRDGGIEKINGPTQTPTVGLQRLNDCGLNPFACVLVAESLLRHHMPERVEFILPINRSDLPGWAGVKFTLEPIAK